MARVTASAPERIVLEATGGFEALVAAALAGAGLPVVVVTMRGNKTGTIRKIQATHRWQKLMRYSAVKFD